MTIVCLSNGKLSAKLSTAGGTVLELWWEREGERIPLLRPAASEDVGPLDSGCFPLAPFGNRVKDNRFEFEGRDYRLTPNVDWDPHYLHGDAWLSDWTVVAQEDDSAQMRVNHEGSPYAYQTRQRFVLAGLTFSIQLDVVNKGSTAMPFGLGWHPYFPMTPRTTLLAPAQLLWTEIENWLPGEATQIPADLDFSRPAELPHRWVNNGLEGWAGTAEINWPERRTKLLLEASDLFRHAFIFVSDQSFDPSYQRDFFCFEPMSHLANGQNMAGLGGLVVLEPGESLSGSFRLTPQAGT